VAAQEPKVRIEIDPIKRAFDALRASADAIEGVGGFLVPLNDREDAGDMTAALGLPIVLVVGMRLGCLNHALLTQQAIAARSAVFRRKRQETPNAESQPRTKFDRGPPPQVFDFGLVYEPRPTT